MELTLKRKPKTPEPAPEILGGATYPIPDPSKPSAMLLPPFIQQRRSEAKAKRVVFRMVAAALVVTLAASGGVFFLAKMAERDLTVARAEKKVADGKVDRYREIAAYHDGLTAREAALTAALSGDIAYSMVSDTVLNAAPGGVEVKSFKYQPGVPCASPDPFVAEAALGCILVGGSATSTAGVGQFVDSLNVLTEDSPIVGAFASAVTSTGGGATDFSVSVNYGPAALSYKYVPEAPATPEVAPVNPVTDAGTTTQEGAEQ